MELLQIKNGISQVIIVFSYAKYAFRLEVKRIPYWQGNKIVRQLSNGNILADTPKASVKMEFRMIILKDCLDVTV